MITSLNIRKGQTHIELDWASGSKNEISAVKLRMNAKDAVALRARYDGKELIPNDNLKITAVELVGQSAFNIQFSDGHHRAIYPFAYLKELSEAP